MEEVNEYELLYLIRQGNNLALQYLVGEYQEYFKRALSQFHVEIVNALGEEDLLQEAQLIFYLVCDRYRRDSKATFRTYVRNCVEKRWCTVITRANITKNQFYYQTLSLDQPTRTSESENSTSCLVDFLADTYKERNPVAMLVVKETLDQVYGVIEEDDRPYTAEITKLKMLGYNNREIARHLSISYKKVSNTVYRVRKKFDLNKQ